MRNLMLPLSPISNDGFLQHKPTLASDGLNSSSRPFAEAGKVRFRAVRKTGTYDLDGWFSPCPLPRERMREAAV